MRELKWEIGANKSLVAITDADYHNPDRDGITLDDVVNLSKSIDPVNIYILTDEEYANAYAELANRTDGKVYTSDIVSAFDEIETEILSRDPGTIYTSTDLTTPTIATVDAINLTQTSASSAQLSFETDATISILTLNEMPAGYTAERTIDITDLDFSQELKICVSPVSSTGFRGEPKCITGNEMTSSLVSDDEEEVAPIRSTIPKAPNTGIGF